jgi:hypothetical protein
MYLARWMAAVSLLAGAWGAGAQDAPEPAPLPGEAGEAAPPEAPPKLRDGDVVHLLNGKAISGVKVLRETPVFVEILGAPGMEPFRIPRKQVREVVLSGVDPFAEMSASPGPGEAAVPDLMQGKELNPEFHKKLIAPLSEEAIAYGKTELIAVIRDLRQRTGLTIRLSDGIRAMPEAERAWDLNLPAGQSLLAVLQQDLLAAFPALVVDLEYEAVSIRTNAEPKPEASPAP